MIVLDEAHIDAGLEQPVFPPNLRKEAALVREPLGSNLDHIFDFEPPSLKHADARSRGAADRSA